MTTPDKEKNNIFNFNNIFQYIDKNDIYISIKSVIDNFPQAGWPSLAEYNQRLAMRAKTEKPIKFIPQTQPHSFTEQYEPRIFLQGEIQTRRENWHDFFNACVWATFPIIKQTMNQLQYQELLRRKTQHDELIGKRSDLENLLTLSDENGIIAISTDDKLLKLLIEHQWEQLFWEHRLAVQNSMRFFVLGHSIYERMLNPYIGLTGKGILIKTSAAWLQQSQHKQIEQADQLISRALLSNQLLHPQQLQPIPVLGIPGWFVNNKNNNFYKNIKYFREKPKVKNNMEKLILRPPTDH